MPPRSLNRRITENALDTLGRRAEAISPLNFSASLGYSGVAAANPYDLFSQSLLQSQPNQANQLKRKTANQLRAIAQIPPIRHAIYKIATGVASMAWEIQIPGDTIDEKKKYQNQKDNLTRSLQRPNVEDKNTYRKLVYSVINDLLTIGCGAIERQEGDRKIGRRPKPGKGSNAFWLWDVDPAVIQLNTSWTPANEGIIPRYWDTAGSRDQKRWIPILNKNLFLIHTAVSSYEITPKSAVEIAFDYIDSWLSVSRFQRSATEKATRNTVIFIEGAEQDDLNAFRQYWQSDVEGLGKTPILGGQGANILNLSAKNDEELYLRYCDYVLKIIAMAFNLSARDMNIESDNRATAGVAADSTFQDGVLPIAQTLVEHLDMEVIKFYYPEYSLRLSDYEPRSEGEEATTASSLYTSGIITRGEGRRRVGEISEPEDEVFFDGTRRNEENPNAPPGGEADPSLDDPFDWS